MWSVFIKFEWHTLPRHCKTGVFWMCTLKNQGISFYCMNRNSVLSFHKSLLHPKIWHYFPQSCTAKWITFVMKNEKISSKFMCLEVKINQNTSEILWWIMKGLMLILHMGDQNVFWIQIRVEYSFLLLNK